MKEIIEQYRQNHREDLIPCMQHIQDKLGYMSEEAISAIGKYFGLPSTKVYGIATFYDYFSFSPVSGDVVRICNGTSCHMLGSGKLRQEAEKFSHSTANKSRKRLNIRLCECQGACSAGPVFQVNEKVFTRVKPEDVKQLISQASEEGKEESNG